MRAGIGPWIRHPLRWYLRQKKHLTTTLPLSSYDGRQRKKMPAPPPTNLYSYKFSAVQVTPLSTRTSTCTNWKARGQGVKSHTCCILYESSKNLQVHLSEKLSSCWVRSETGTQKSWLPEPVIFHGARTSGSLPIETYSVYKGQGLLSL